MGGKQNEIDKKTTASSVLYIVQHHTDCAGVDILHLCEYQYDRVGFSRL